MITTATSVRARRARLATVALTAGVALFASACSSSSGGTTGGASSAAVSSAAPVSSAAAPSSATVSTGKRVGVTLILKTLSNPYFVSMKDDAMTAAKANNVDLTVAAGQQDGDTATQITAIDNAISRGDQGILITTNGDAVNAALNQAKQKGLFVIALDTAPNPPSTANITFATDNLAAGKLDGEYAAKALNGKKAVIAMLDLFNNQVVSVDIDRDHGFLEGMGINPGSTSENAKEAKSGTYKGLAGGTGSYTIACHQPTQGAVTGGVSAMQNCLSSNPDINVVYAINEPAAEGAYNVLKQQNKQSGVQIYAIDGSCAGLKFLTTGEFTADAVQYPGRMASLGVAAIAKLARGGSKPTTSAGLAFYNTGTALATNKPLAGITSETEAQASKDCWGS